MYPMSSKPPTVYISNYSVDRVMYPMCDVYPSSVDRVPDVHPMCPVPSSQLLPLVTSSVDRVMCTRCVQSSQLLALVTISVDRVMCTRCVPDVFQAPNCCH